MMKHPSTELLIDYIYDLLEPADRQEVEQLLQTSSEWQIALEKARSEQQIFAAAAKGCFPDVRFQAPKKVPSSHEAETILLPKRTIQRRSGWIRWAVAACLAIAFIGGGSYAGMNWWRFYAPVQNMEGQLASVEERARDIQEQQREEFLKRREEIRAIQEQIKLLEAKWKGELEQVDSQKTDDNLRVMITGPKTLQAGARNEYLIETRKHNKAAAKETPVATTVAARIVSNKEKKVLFETKLSNPQGVCKLEIPRDLPVKPHEQIFLQVVALGEKGDASSIEEPLPLIGTHFLTHLTVDKPMYRPGEAVRFRSLTLDRVNLRPAQEDLLVEYVLKGPSGEVLNDSQGKKLQLRGTTHLRSSAKDLSANVLGPDGQLVRGIGSGEFRLPVEAPGGVYTLEVREANNKFPTQKRTFLVNKYQAPRLNKELEFTRKSYGPGDEVVVQCKVSRVEGGQLPVGTPVIATVQLDGRQIHEINTAINEMQNVPEIRFSLPKHIRRGIGTISVQFQDGTVETIVRPLPIVLNDLLVDFYPEGGDLVADLPNRVYFSVRTPTGKPAELKGRIVDSKGNAVISIETLHDDTEMGVNQGLGSFQFTPKANETYRLQIDTPLNITARPPLPLPKKDGVTLSIPNGDYKETVDVQVTSLNSDKRLLVGAYCRGRLIDHQKLTVKANVVSNVKLRPLTDVSGVYRVTVFEERQAENRTVQYLPVAERLIYRQPTKKLNFRIVPDKKRYVPGDPVHVTISAQDEKESPVPAVVLVSVVDKSIIKLADDKTERGLPAHFYLTTEIKSPQDLEYADFLVSDHPKATVALDHLLGTQGWRRFIEQDPKLFQRQRHQAEHLFVADAAAEPQQRSPMQQLLTKVDEKYAPQWRDQVTMLTQIETEANQLASQANRQLQSIESEREQIQVKYSTARKEFNDYYQRLVLWIGVLSLSVLGLAGVCCSILVITRFVQGKRQSPFPLVVTVGFITAALSVSYATYSSRVAVKKTEREDAVAMKAEAGGVPEMAPAADMAAEGRPNEMPMPMAPAGGAQIGNPENKKLMVRNFEPQLAPNANRVLGAMPPNFNPPMVDAMEEMPPMAMDLDAVGNAERDRPALAIGRPQAMPIPNPGAPPMQQRGGRQGLFFGNERALRQRGRLFELAQQRLGRSLTYVPPATMPLVVREYAHQHIPADDGIRRDFTETLFWHPVIVLPEDGAVVRFDLSDSVTTFQVQVHGHTLDGRLGSQTADIVSKLPFTIEPKVPTEISNTDKVIIPVAVANDTSKVRKVDLSAETSNLQIKGSDSQQFVVNANERLRRYLEFTPTTTKGHATLLLRGRCEPFGVDAVERQFQIVPEGFPFVGAQSDILEGQAIHSVTLPEQWIKGSLQAKVQVFPSTLADLQSGLEAMLREPNGCFEQTSTTNYPNVMILSYLKETDQNLPEIEKKATGLLQRGYGKLTSFECIAPKDNKVRRGYEWFGNTAPPHEGLTAYGLLQFKDMSQFTKVDEDMMKRTEDYLLAQRDGKGGFRRNPRSLDSFGRAPDYITDAYIVWALTEAGRAEEVTKELDALLTKAKDQNDSYFLGLVALSANNSGKTKEAIAVLKKIAENVQEDGSVGGAKTSITSSGGRDLQIETTALAVLGWLRVNRPDLFQTNVQKAVEWIGKQRGGFGGFGSTQSTILALKALIAHARDNAKTASSGELQLYVNDQLVGTTSFPADQREEITVEVPTDKLSVFQSGENKVKAVLTNNTLPYTFSWSYNTRKPNNAANVPLQLETTLDRTEAKEGETVQMTARVKNKTKEGYGMTVAVVGLPAGLSIPEDMKLLKEMIRLPKDGSRPLVSYFEIRDRELILYWRDLAPEQTIEVPIQLICRIPGEYRGAASRAYLYYNSDARFWCEPLSMKIDPAN